jgi:hypothetical protein
MSDKVILCNALRSPGLGLGDRKNTLNPTFKISSLQNYGKIELEKKQVT